MIIPVWFIRFCPVALFRNVAIYWRRRHGLHGAHLPAHRSATDHRWRPERSKGAVGQTLN
jgi:hypothetical protein